MPYLGLRHAFGLFLLLCVCWVPGAHAQWLTQQIKLVPGFNPVYLEVTPLTNDCATVFGSTPGIRSVWMYNRYVQLSTFSSSQAQTVPSQDHWLMWFPTAGPKAFLSTLAQVRGGQCYLVVLATNAAPVTITVKGVPNPPRIDWIPFDLALTGFPISETAKVNFYQFMKDNPEVSSTPGSGSGLYSISTSTARESQIRNPELTSITPGTAYWVRLANHTINPFPFGVTAAGQNNSLQFSATPSPSVLTLMNSVKTAPQTLHLRLLDSESPPAGAPNRAGAAPVAAMLPQADGTLLPAFLTQGLDLTLAAGETRQVQIVLVKDQLTPSSDTNATYQSLLEVTEASHGYRQLVPVVALVPGSAAAVNLLGTVTGHKQDLSPVTAPAPSAGLWVGTVTMNQVNQPGFSQDNNPDPSAYPLQPATPLQVRALIHVDSNGVPRLLEQVFFADIIEGTNTVTHMYNSLEAVPAGTHPKSRVSAPSWPALPPTSMSGNWGNTISTTLTVPYNDRVNPYVHRYHPDHNNLAEDFKTVLPAGVESFDITRNVSFYFGDTTKSGASIFSPNEPAMKFSGAAGEYVSTSAFTNMTSFTVQFWLNIPTNRQNGATLVLLTNTASGTMFRIGFDPANNGKVVVALQNQAGTSGALSSTNPVPVGKWFNLTTTYDGANVKIFFDGIKDVTGQLPGLEPSAGAWSSAWIGNSSTTTSPSFIGEIHDVIVRDDATTESMVPEVTLVPQLFNASGIDLELQGSGVATNVVNRGPTLVNINYTGPSLVDLSSAPAAPLWTYGTASGAYLETITGLRRQTITVGGTFQFTRVNQDSDLR